MLPYHSSIAAYAAGLWYIAQPATTLFATKSSHLVAHLAIMPYPLYALFKVGFGASFCYHAANGIRHLLWDSGRGLSLDGVYKGGYAVLAFTTVGTIGLCML